MNTASQTISGEASIEDAIVSEAHSSVSLSDSDDASLVEVTDSEQSEPSYETLSPLLHQAFPSYFAPPSTREPEPSGPALSNTNYLRFMQQISVVTRMTAMIDNYNIFSMPVIPYPHAVSQPYLYEFSRWLSGYSLEKTNSKYTVELLPDHAREGNLGYKNIVNYVFRRSPDCEERGQAKVDLLRAHKARKATAQRKRSTNDHNSSPDNVVDSISISEEDDDLLRDEDEYSTDKAIALIYDPLYWLMLLSEGFLPVTCTIGGPRTSDQRKSRIVVRDADRRETLFLLDSEARWKAAVQDSSYLGPLRGSFDQEKRWLKCLLFCSHHHCRSGIDYAEVQEYENLTCQQKGMPMSLGQDASPTRQLQSADSSTKTEVPIGDDRRLELEDRFQGTVFSVGKSWRRKRKNAERLILRYNSDPYKFFKLIMECHEDSWLHAEYCIMLQRITDYMEKMRKRRTSHAEDEPGYGSLMELSQDSIVLNNGVRVALALAECYDPKIPCGTGKFGTMVACDLGILVGSTYISLSGAHRSSSPGSGTSMLIRIIKDQRLCGVKYFDLGMVMKYKSTLLGARVYSRREYLAFLRPGQRETLLRIDGQTN